MLTPGDVCPGRRRRLRLCRNAAAPGGGGHRLLHHRLLLRFAASRDGGITQGPPRSLRTGTYLAAGLSALAAAPLLKLTVDSWDHVVGFSFCGSAGGAIGYFTEYYTSDYKPTKELAAASETGSATIIGGISPASSHPRPPSLNSWRRPPWSIWDFSTRACTASASPRWACFPPGIWRATPTGLWQTIRRRHRGDERPARRSVSAPTRWTPWATPPQPPARRFRLLTALALLVSYVNIVQSGTEEVLDLSVTNPLILVGLFIGAMLTLILCLHHERGAEGCSS